MRAILNGSKFTMNLPRDGEAHFTSDIMAQVLGFIARRKSRHGSSRAIVFFKADTVVCFFNCSTSVFLVSIILSRIIYVSSTVAHLNKRLQFFYRRTVVNALGRNL